MSLFQELDAMLKQDERDVQLQEQAQEQAQEQQAQEQAQAHQAQAQRWERQQREAAEAAAEVEAEAEAEHYYRKRFPQTALNSQAIRRWIERRTYEIYGAPSFYRLDAEQRKEFCDWILALPGRRKALKPRESLWRRIWNWILDR